MKKSFIEFVNEANFDFNVAYKNFDKSSELQQTHGTAEIHGALDSLRYAPRDIKPLTNFLKGKKSAKWEDMYKIIKDDMKWKDGQARSFVSLIYQHRKQK